MNRFTPILGASLLAFCVMQARAEKPTGHGDAPQPAAGMPRLSCTSADPAVQRELNLKSPQEQAVDDLVAEVDYPLFLLRDVPATDQRDTRVFQPRRVETGLRATLEAPQRQRLSELLLLARAIRLSSATRLLGHASAVPNAGRGGHEIVEDVARGKSRLRHRESRQTDSEPAQSRTK